MPHKKKLIQPNHRYSKSRVRSAFETAHQILSDLKSQSLGKYQVYLFNPQLIPKVTMKKNPHSRTRKMTLTRF